MDITAAIVVSIIAAATPLLFAALGELMTEKSGVLNLGVEGMMLLGAVASFATAIATGIPSSPNGVNLVNTNASGISITHMLINVTSIGASVSPAILNDC